MWPEEGAEWLAGFPSLLERVCRSWGLSDLEPVPELSYNFVAFAMRGLEPVVLKMGVSVEELAEEERAVRTFPPDAGARLLDAMPGALMLERLQPGISLWQLWHVERDEEHTQIAADLMRRLWKPAGQAFPSFDRWARAFPAYLERFPGPGPIPRAWVEKAHETASSFGGATLLHGDLHHGNILQAGGGWKAIDPKGVVGDPALEVGSFLRNPCNRILQAPYLGVLLERRLEVFSRALEMSLERLAAASFCVCILSACWSAECDESADDALACAGALIGMSG